MNIEIRHILRWGVPGWVFIIANLVSLFYIKPELFNVIQKSKLGVTFLTAAILLWTGIVVGYLFYQVYFGFRELIREINKYKDPVAYKAKEGYIWHMLVLETKDVDDRKYISERYAYYLTVLHGFGSLLVVWLVTILIDIFLIIFFGNDWFMGTKISIEICFAFFAFMSFTHYHFDLQNFRTVLLNNNSKVLDSSLLNKKESTD